MNAQAATRPQRLRSLQSRLLVWVLGAVGVVWLGVVWATWYDTEHEIGELLDAHLSQAAALLVSQPLDDLDDLAHQETPVLHEYQPKVVLQVWHLDTLVVRSATAPEQALAGHEQRGFSDVVIGTASWRVFSVQGKDEHIVIHVAEQDQARADVIWASLRSVIWPMALALPLLGVAVWWAVRSAVQPLKDLGERVSLRRPDAADPLPLDNVPEEAQPLGQELNRLFARTAQVIEAERRFTADAAHELRTPIAAIRMQAQVAQGAQHVQDAQALTQALAATVQGCDRAARLVEQLLQLARLEAQTTPDTAVGNWWTCLQTVVTDAAPVAATRQQRLEVHVAPNAPAPSARWLPVPEALATVLLRNVVDNALRYSPPGAVVRVSCTPWVPGGTEGQGHRPDTTLTVEDSGPGLSADDMTRLGERFFRVLGSGQPGSGLGWSIVARISRLYGIQVAVSRSPTLGGLQVALSWATPPCDAD
jgi:two-component system sensor histidine kinase QseC